MENTTLKNLNIINKNRFYKHKINSTSQNDYVSFLKVFNKILSVLNFYKNWVVFEFKNKLEKKYIE